MPVVFRPADVLELNKYGIFTKWRLPGVEIPASAAVSITAAQTNTWRDPFEGEDPYYDLEFPIREWRGIDKWGIIIERFNWGKTSRPDKVYYEIWNYGKLVMPQEQEGFHCCGKIGTSDEDNRCVPPGTLVMSNPGLKPIEELKVGDLVLTKEGRYKRVIRTYKDPFRGDLLRIRAYHLPEITVTPNHKIWASKGNGFKWIEAKDLEIGDKIILSFPAGERDVSAIKITDYIDTKDLWVEDGKVYGSHPHTGKNPKAHPVPEYIPISNDFLRIVGYYLSEGYTTPHYLKFAFNIEEREYILDLIMTMNKLFNLPATVYPRSNAEAVEIQFGCLPLARLFKTLFSTGAHNKKLPEFFMHLPKEKLREIIKGCFRGDGSNTSKKGKRIELCTTSINLANQLRLILLKLGIVTSFREEDNSRGFCNGKPSKIYRIYADGYTQLTQEIFGATPIIKEKHPRKGYIEGNHLVTPIYSISKVPYSGYVYNIEVEDDHSYNLLGGTVSNSTHPTAAEKLKLKLWNCSDPPEDVYIEFTMWYYVFPLEHLDEVMAMSYESFFGMLHDDLNAILSELRKEETPKGFPIPPPHFPAKRR